MTFTDSIPRLDVKLVEIVRADFFRLLREVGMTAEQLAELTLNPHDQTHMPFGYGHLRLAASEIESVGLFTDISIRAGEVIGPALIAGKRTPLGRFANHSPWPNTEFRLLANGDKDSIALTDLLPGAEILNNYRQGAALCGVVFNMAEVLESSRLRELALVHLLRDATQNVRLP